MEDPSWSRSQVEVVDMQPPAQQAPLPPQQQPRRARSGPIRKSCIAKRLFSFFFFHFKVLQSTDCPIFGLLAFNSAFRMARYLKLYI